MREPDNLFQEEIDSLRREVAAFHKIHPQLLEQHFGHYVAMYGGKVVDHDKDRIALMDRIYRDYPSETVLVRQVQQEPEQVLYFRSPRFVEHP